MTAKKKTGPRRVRIEIREATEDDLGDIVDLWELLVEHHRAYSDHFKLARDGRRKWSAYLKEKFSEKSTKLIVAEEEGKLVGFMLCLMSPGRPIFSEKAVGVISDAYVVKHRRKKGVMKEMLVVALRWFHKNKIKAAEVNVSAANLEARNAWGQLGFKPIMVRKRLLLGDHPAKAMIEGKIKGSKKRVARKKG
ncbi:MAG: GNAT family N-acetyltransferase [Thermoplasmata archaeon]|nr:GNAT family N-acetyltransferase [Thermoplasmata archaeon]